MELSSCQPRGAYNFEVTPIFLKIFAPLLKINAERVPRGNQRSHSSAL